jgi:hypothetical protein
MDSPPRFTRNTTDLKKALKENIELLRDSIDKVKSGDTKYIKVIFALLRILVIEKGKNKALLLGLADKFKIVPMVYLDVPFGPTTMPLKEHLQGLYFASATEKIKLTNTDFILKHSQQEGASHEDWALEKEVTFPNKGILIGGLPPKVRKAVILGEHVYKTGIDLLGKI